MKDLIERLREGFQHGDSANVLEAATALEKQAAEIEQLKVNIAACSNEYAQLQAEAVIRENEVAEANGKINDLQTKLSAMEAVEPVGFISPHDLQMLSEGYPRTVVMLAGAKHTEALFTAPKVSQPLPIARLREIERNQVYNNTATLIDFARAIEKAHGIGGAPKSVEPLTELKADEIALDVMGFAVLDKEQAETARLLIRATERAHGIGGQHG